MTINGGTVTIATHGSVMTFLLPGVINQFKKDQPGSHLSVLHRSREEILSMVSHGEADLGITSLGSIPNNLEYQPLAHFDRILITSKGHPLAKKRTITLEDISKYPLILPTRETNTRKTIDKVFEEERLTPKIAGSGWAGSSEDLRRNVFNRRATNDSPVTIFNKLYQINELYFFDLGFSFFLNGHDLHPPYCWRGPHALRLVLWYCGVLL